MTDEQRNEFPATALIDTSVKVLDIAGAGDELLEAIKDLVSMGRIGDDRTLGLHWRPRLEVFVPAHGDVAVFGALRRAVVLSWDEWDDQRMESASLQARSQIIRDTPKCSGTTENRGVAGSIPALATIAVRCSGSDGRGLSGRSPA